MMTRLIVAAALASGAAVAQHGTEPRPKASEYPVNGTAGDVLLGAEYLVRSAGTGNEMFIIPEHLIIEIAAYPPKGRTVEVSAGHFALRVNGKKTLLHPQPAGMAVAAMKYPDWSERPTPVGTVGYGDKTVVIGQPRRVERFPGDNRPQETRVPMPQQASVRDGNTRTPEEIVVEAALPEGPTADPISGYLYFPYKGKPKKIKTLELLYNNGDHKATLKLF